MTMKKFILINSVLLLTSFISQAQTAYISNVGGGNGYSNNDPASIEQLNNLLEDPLVDRIELQPGIYKQTDALYLYKGEHPVEVVGLNKVTLSSNYNYYSGSNSGIVLAHRVGGTSGEVSVFCAAAPMFEAAGGDAVSVL